MCSFRHPACLVKVSSPFRLWKSFLSAVAAGWLIWWPSSPKSSPRLTWVVVPKQCSPINKCSVGEEHTVVCVSRQRLLWAWVLQNRYFFCATQPLVNRGFLFFPLFCLCHAEDLLRLSLIFTFLCNVPFPPLFFNPTKQNPFLFKVLAIASYSWVLLPIFATFSSVSLLPVCLCSLKDLYVKEEEIKHSTSCQVKQAESRFH